MSWKQHGPSQRTLRPLTDELILWPLHPLIIPPSTLLLSVNFSTPSSSLQPSSPYDISLHTSSPGLQTNYTLQPNDSKTPPSPICHLYSEHHSWSGWVAAGKTPLWQGCRRSRVLKACAPQLSGILHHVFGMSLSLQRVPVMWNTSCLVPVASRTTDLWHWPSTSWRPWRDYSWSSSGPWSNHSWTPYSFPISPNL